MPQNCDFFIVELIKNLNYSVFCANDESARLKRFSEKLNIPACVKSTYDGNWCNEEILDDAITAKNIHGYSKRPCVGIYRSGTATQKDYYDYDIIVRISGLKSGCSNKIDGEICIFERDNILYSFKYKVFNDKIIYFD